MWTLRWVMSAVVATVLTALVFAGEAEGPDVWVRVQCLERGVDGWTLRIVVHPAHLKQADLFVGQELAEKTADLKPLGLAARSPWVNLTSMLGKGTNSVRFLFEPFQQFSDKGVRAAFEFATAPQENAIIRRVKEHDTGNVIAFRVPRDPVKDTAQLVSVREDTVRRLGQVRGFRLSDGPLPRQIWCMTGFRSNGQFYTDPSIARMDFQIIRALGMNGFWEQGGGQWGSLRKMAAEHDIDRSTVYWRSVASPPVDRELGGVRLDWARLEAFIDDVYRRDIASTRRSHPDGLPVLIADLMDEPAGLSFAGPEYQQEFRLYLEQQGLSAEFFGRRTWEEIETPQFNWWQYFSLRGQQDLNNEFVRRWWYWAVRFWNHANARLYATATRAVEKYAPGVGTRVNFGPPWWYDYGTLPRGIDAFEFGRLRGVTLNFNEDWVGNGDPRWPLEINTFLMDWGRGALRPQRPIGGSYITRDANHTAVKLRTFGCLAREAKIFDFYYYGPAYTHFDHWSDNASMVQGVGELTRDIGAVDDLLWEGTAPVAEVALLYSKSWPVWKSDDTEQVEQMMVYLALLHAGIPVDIVSDEEVADGRFAAQSYKCLYVVNESVPQAAQQAIREWVRNGGRLWLTGWAGLTDEYNTSSAVWNDMLGVVERAWEPAGNLDRYGEEIKPADWRRPFFHRLCRVRFTVPTGVDSLNIFPPIGEGEPRTPAFRRAFGKGLVQVVLWTVGKAYLETHQRVKGTLADAIRYPDGEARQIIAEFAVEAGVRRPAVTSADQVLAWPLWGQDRGVILLANFTGEPVDALEVRFESHLPVRTVRSLRVGELKHEQADGAVSCTLPMAQVTDILVVQ